MEVTHFLNIYYLTKFCDPMLLSMSTLNADLVKKEHVPVVSA